MKILFVIPGLGNSGGAETSLMQTCYGLVQNGHTISIVCLSNINSFQNHLKSLKVQVIYYPVVGKSWLRKIFGFRRLVYKINPDIVHSILFDADILVRFSFISNRIKIISTWASTNYSSERRIDSRISWYKIQIVKYIDIFSAKISKTYFHAVTKGVAEQGILALKAPQNKVFVVERSRDRMMLGYRSRERYEITRNRLGISCNIEIVLSVARHVHVKGLDTLIEAFALVRNLRKNCILLIAGETTAYTEELNRIIETHGLRHKIIFLGVRDDVPDLLSCSDVFVLASRYEGAAGAIIEAMALEVPIIATKIYGTKGIVIDNHNSLVVNPRDPIAIADSINKILEDRSLRDKIVKNSLKYYNNNFTSDKVLEKTIKMYYSIINN